MYSLTLQNAGGDNVISSGDILGRINFAVPSESDGAAATYIAGQIFSQSEGSFTSASNPASLVFATSNTDSSPASGVLKVSHQGHFLPLASGQFDLGSSSHPFRNLYVDGGIVTAPSGYFDVISFNVDDESTLTKGQISWDDTEGTLDIGLTDNTTIHIGEHRYFRIRNQTGSPLYKGQVVYATGVHTNGLITPAKYVADGTVREVRFMGVVLEDVDNNNNGYVIDFGHLENMDLDGSTTNYAAGDETWGAGDILYVHPTVAGKLTKVEPKHSISVAIVLNPGNGNGNGEMFVRPISYGHLDDNHDVAVSGATNGQFLQYNSATDYWVPSSSGNFTALQVSGTPVPTGVGVSNYFTKWIGTNSLGTGIIYDDGTNVGIGTSLPSSKLDISGVITAVSGNSNNWNTAYSWGDHSTSGYLTDISSQNIQDLNNVENSFSDPLLLNENILIYDSGIGAFKGSTINLGLIKQGSIPLTGYGSSYLGYYIRMNNGEFTVNEQGANLDFRVEGDTIQSLLFTDASSDSVGIGTNEPAAPLHLVRPKNAIYGSFLIQDSTPMAQNVGGSIVFGGRYTSGNDDARFGQIAALKANSTDGDTQSVLSFITNDGSSFTEKMRILPSGNVAIGSTGSDSHRFSIRGNINQNNAIGIFSDTAYGSAATSGNIYDVYSRGQINAYTLQNHYHFFTSVPSLTNGATVNNELCYTASHSTSGVVSQRGFYSTINGSSSWQLYMGGSAPNYIEGNVGVGISNPSSKLQVENGSVVFNSAAGNYDFTVGGDTDIHTLCVDASADSVGIGLNTPLSTLHIEKNGVTSLRLQRSAPVGTSAVPVERSHILFSNYNNAYDHIKLISWGRESNFLAGMLGVNISNNSGVSSEVLTIDNQSTAGTFGLRTYNIPLVTTSGNVIFNETAGNFDFRAEGLTDPNLLFVDASADRVGIGTSSPTHKLHVAGSGYMDWTQLQSNYYINYPILGPIAGNSNRDQIILFAPTGVATLFRGYIDSNSTATSNEYLRNFSRTFIHYRTSADVNTVPQVTVNGVYNGNQSDLAANDNGRVVKVLYNGVEYWGLIMQDLGSFVSPGQPVFNGYASSLTDFQYGHRDGFTTVTDITPNTAAGRSASLFRYQNLSVPDGNVGVGTNNPTSRLHVEGGNIVFNDAGGNFDFRVEGDTDTNLLFVDASVDAIGIGTNSPTEKLDINSDAIRIRTAQTPASATALGNAGDICWDSNYIYVCVATNTWKRSALSTWP